MIPSYLSTALLNHLWQSTAVVGIAWLLVQVLKKNHARVRYWVWMAASVKFLLPFSLLISAGEWVHSFVPAVFAAKPTAAGAMEQITQPFPQMKVFETTGAQAAAHHANWLPMLPLAMWLSGALIAFARFARGWWMVCVAKRGALRLELAADIPMLCSSNRIEPGIVGIFRPVLMLPEGILESLTAGQLRAVIAHEMAHVRRRDNLTFVVHMIVETLFWFHPAVWWIGSRLIDERERACDEAVVQAGGEAETYAEGILNVCKFCVESPLACVSGVTGADLKKRIARIMTEQIGRKLNLRRKALLAAAGSMAVIAPIVAGLVAAGRGAAQSAASNAVTEPRGPMQAGANPSFEVATIKPSDPNLADKGWGFPVEGRRVTCYNATLLNIISVAYGIHVKQIVGGPDWISKDRFDVEGVPDIPGSPDIEQSRVMWQKLLADRFNLKIHRDVRDLPVYVVSVAKGGPKNLSAANPGEHLNAGNRGGSGERTLRFTNMPMSVFAFNLDFYLDRPVLDETGLTGRYDFTLKWTYDDTRVEDSQAPPSLPTALREELGLEMKAGTGPAEVLVVDSAERPSAN
jgi:bla regulator protein blaR1